MHALPEKQVIFFPEYGNNPPFLSIRQVLHNGLEDRNYQIQEPGPVEHLVTSFVVWRRLFHNSIYAYCFYSSPVYTILKKSVALSSEKSVFAGLTGKCVLELRYTWSIWGMHESGQKIAGIPHAFFSGI